MIERPTPFRRADVGNRIEPHEAHVSRINSRRTEIHEFDRRAGEHSGGLHTIAQPFFKEFQGGAEFLVPTVTDRAAPLFINRYTAIVDG